MNEPNPLPPDVSDEALAARAAAGEERALELLLSRHYRLIYRAAYRYCGHRENAEDIAHEACLKLARSIRGYRGEAGFKTWMYRVVVNCAKDYGRKERLNHRMEADYLREAVETVSGGQEERQAARSVLALLDSLPAGMKETAWLVHAEGMTHKEASLVLDCAETTISWRLHQLKKYLSREKGGR